MRGAEARARVTAEADWTVTYVGFPEPPGGGSARKPGWEEAGGQVRSGRGGVALTAEELILGRHGALHDLWLDEASTESICV